MSDRRLPWTMLLLCLILSTPAHAGRLPDGGTARAGGSGIVAAWYEDPTSRYDHGILGDAIEAGTLVARDSKGNSHAIVLPESEVFEDITPRLADLDGDGNAEVIAIRSSLSAGASLAIYGLRDGKLQMVAATPFIGRAHRWICPAGIADFDGDGRVEIALVATPHIGGTLEFWRLRGSGLSRIAALGGFSNHTIGSRNLAEAATGDVDGDGVPELVLPDATRTSLAAVALQGSRAIILDKQPLGGTATGSIRLDGANAQVDTSAGRRRITFAVPRR
ncbi:MAG: VCBS repeat-containing protein [Rhodobiaceae bacterium]|nr:VCBS repeat-containing protein [Rhodobiaceae bacterium]MCC0054761.1 VCBS repeat-containing protein [Rhodobiaceae bacterium]